MVLRASPKTDILVIVKKYKCFKRMDNYYMGGSFLCGFYFDKNGQGWMNGVEGRPDMGGRQ